jgi:hypothetical protein
VIFDTLIEQARLTSKQYNLKLVECCVGSFFTHTVIESENKKYIGLTLTPKDEGEIYLTEYTSLDDVFDKSKYYDISKRAVALSAVNAVGQFLFDMEKIDLKDNLRTLLADFINNHSSKEDKIVFIGNLSPVVLKLKQSGKNVDVFCRQTNDKYLGVYNDIFEYEGISKADIVVITGASLIGSTIDAVLKFTQKARIVILAGFSAGGHYAWYENMGITHIASVTTSGFVMSKNTVMEDIFEQKCYLKEIGN